MFADEQQHCAQEALECILSVLEDIVGVDLSEVRSEQSTTYTCVTDTCSNSRIEKSCYFLNILNADYAPTLHGCLNHVERTTTMLCTACCNENIRNKTWEEKSSLTKPETL